MKALKNNIDHYMELKNIKMYSHLLADIARELGMKGQEAYRFAKREKANFSKMLKGERPLKYEFIIPLESRDSLCICFPQAVPCAVPSLSVRSTRAPER